MSPRPLFAYGCRACGGIQHATEIPVACARCAVRFDRGAACLLVHRTRVSGADATDPASGDSAKSVWSLEFHGHWWAVDKAQLADAFARYVDETGSPPLRCVEMPAEPAWTDATSAPNSTRQPFPSGSNPVPEICTDPSFQH